jgi:hypothetical protein
MNQKGTVAIFVIVSILMIGASILAGYSPVNKANALDLNKNKDYCYKIVTGTIYCFAGDAQCKKEQKEDEVATSSCYHVPKVVNPEP